VVTTFAASSPRNSPRLSTCCFFLFFVFLATQNKTHSLHITNIQNDLCCFEQYNHSQYRNCAILCILCVILSSYTNNWKRPSVCATEVCALYGCISCGWLSVVCAWRYGGKWAWLARRGRCTASSWVQWTVRINWGLLCTTVQATKARLWLVYLKSYYIVRRLKSGFEKATKLVTATDTCMESVELNCILK